MNNNKDIRMLQIKVEMQALITGVEGFIAAVDVRDNYMPYIPDRKESK